MGGKRFFINLVLVRVLYAHALVAGPQLALGRLAPLAPRLGDPRLGMAGLFLSISRILPATYPLDDPLEAAQLGEPGLRGLFVDRCRATPGRLPTAGRGSRSRPSSPGWRAVRCRCRASRPVDPPNQQTLQR
jgi:hypothetical protein